MDKRTAEVIMVLKNNHNLREGLSEDLPNMGPYLHDLALYMSDNCYTSFSYYQKHPSLLASTIHNAVMDYISTCDNPRFFLWNYFEAKRLFGEDIPPLRSAIYNDAQCWCSALQSVAVRGNGGKLVNGFTEADLVDYRRKRQFLP